MDQFNLPVALSDWRNKAKVRNEHVYIPAISLPEKVSFM